MTPDNTPDAGALRPEQLGTYFALMEAVSLLQRAVEQQLQTEGDLSYVQFQLLARLVDAGRPLTMTELADGVVYSRSGLTHQAGLLEKAGLITRKPSSHDQRATMVTLTEEGLARVGRVLPGHIDVTRRLLFASLSDDDVDALGGIMTRVRDHMRQQPDSTARGRRTAPKNLRGAVPSE
ncbi:MarR family winged helix-turn-helix transcriptional regulator [Streptomyces erythrochromogenes]|uniref:MarR family winged helix-turn-helix transcriptional regulator n=1 Tax=Streptomyces erythrochromogenes TaxID=285574 RepID=UPI003633B542